MNDLFILEGSVENNTGGVPFATSKSGLILFPVIKILMENLTKATLRY